MKVSTFSKTCGAVVVEIVESFEPYNVIATIDYRMRENEGNFYSSWFCVPKEIKDKTIDFFTASKVESRKGLENGIRVYVK